RSSAARAATLPCSASSFKRERRTESNDTSAAAKNPFNATISTSKMSRKDIEGSVQSSSVILHTTAPCRQSEHSGFGRPSLGRRVLGCVAAAASGFGRAGGADFGEGHDCSRRV